MNVEKNASRESKVECLRLNVEKSKVEGEIRFEVWRKACDLTKAIYEVTGKNEFARDYGLRDQIRRATVSVISHIAEGFERRGDKEF